ncbi:MAG: nucleotidyltransferase family protein [Calditrichaeota bacterium]|nr:nucleotidyltransferase family protein [Calditrichota bacterium]MCB9368634.1 nucleotidyltransferase family protein [Calditrichota bacterium]
MKAIVLAAGVGSRLGELTKNAPKCLLPVAGRPLLDYWCETLANAGVTDVFINTHHHAALVREFIGTRPHGLNFNEGYEETLLGSAGTLRSAKEFLSDSNRFFIIYADNYVELDLTKLARFHEEKNSPPLVLVAYPTDEPTRCGILEIDDTGLVVSFEEKPARPKSNFANSGIHAATPELFNWVPENQPADIGFHVLPQLVGKMYGYVTDEYIQDIGTPEAYAAVRARRERNL